MESTGGDSSDFSPIELLPTEILQKIFIGLPVNDRVRVERVCKRWKNVSTKEVWKDVQGLFIASRFYNYDLLDYYFEDTNKFSKLSTMENNILYIDGGERGVIHSLVSRAGQHVKEFICHLYPIHTYDDFTLSIVATYCYNIENIQLLLVDDSNIEVLSRLLEFNKKLHSFSCRYDMNCLEIVPLKDWKSLYIGGHTQCPGERLQGIQKKQWEKKVVALIKNSPSLEKIYVYDWTPNILIAISECRELKNLVFPIQDEIATDNLMMNTSLLNRLTCLKVEVREDEDDRIVNLLRHCINLKSLHLYFNEYKFSDQVQEAVLALPTLETLELDSADFTDKLLSRLLHFRHLRFKNTLLSVTENGIFQMITSSECLEKLELLDIQLTTEFFKRLVQNTRKRRKILKMRVDPYNHEKASEICKNSKIHIIKERDDLVENIKNCILYH